MTPVAVAPVVLPPGWLRARGEYQERALREAGAGIAGLVGAGVALVGGLLLLVPHTGEFFTYVLPHLAGGTTGWENKSMVGFVARTFQQFGQPSLRKYFD